MYYNNKLANSTNKPKTAWSIIKTITNNKKNPNDIQVLMIEIGGKITTHHQTMAEEFNNYYVSVAYNMFVVENKSIFQLKSEMHGINTRQNSNLYQPQANLTLYQKGFTTLE